MSQTIQQTVHLDAPAGALFDSYLDAARHAAITGGAVHIEDRVDAAFRAFDGMIYGKNLAMVPKRLIVQAWRSRNWNARDADSILVLSFSDEGPRGRIDLVHANVPDHDLMGVTEGWNKYYWQPWQKHLQDASKTA